MFAHSLDSKLETTELDIQGREGHRSNKPITDLVISTFFDSIEAENKQSASRLVFGGCLTIFNDTEIVEQEQTI